MPHMTVVVNIRDQDCRLLPGDVYIGRMNTLYGFTDSKWQNPFFMKRDTMPERLRVIAEFKAWIKKQPKLMKALHELKGRRLVCWCAPKPCHGDVLRHLAIKYCSSRRISR